jgi:hypothetical protein
MAIRGDLEIEVEDFFGSAAKYIGGGGGEAGYNIDYELAKGEDVETWVARLRDLLRSAGAGSGTFFEVYPDGWEPGMAWRRVEVFGSDRWITQRESNP